MKRTAGALAAVLLAALGPVSASAQGPAPAVTIENLAYGPDPIEALPGDTVTWANHDGTMHTVTARDGSFDSGDLAGGRSWAHTFGDLGRFSYFCQYHRGMAGEVDVVGVILDPLPSGPVAPGSQVILSGRTADTTDPVHVEANPGDGFATAATATPAADGRWQAPLRVRRTEQIRVSSGSAVSRPEHLTVRQPGLRVALRRSEIAVLVQPRAAGALVGLQLFERDRFGWWQVATERLNRTSQTRFALPAGRPVPARVVRLAPDGWTVLETSRVLLIPRG